MRPTGNRKPDSRRPSGPSGSARPNSSRATAGAPNAGESQRSEGRQRDRFKTRRSVVIGGERGTKQFSLRILAVVMTAIVAAIIVTPTLTSYYSQQRELAAARTELGDIEERNKELENELKLWNDDDFVRAEARERLGYVMPGQTLYVVNDPSEGTAQEQLEERIQSVNRDRRAATPWFMTMWDSIDVAGQSVSEFDNPNNAPVIDPTGQGTVDPNSGVEDSATSGPAE